MIKAILWDIDGTVLDFLAAERAAIRRCFVLYGLGECSDAMLDEYSAINVKYWQRLERGEMTKPEILIGRFAEFFRNHGIDEKVAVPFNAEYQIRLGDTIVFQPGAMETIQALRGRLIQCAVTNGTKIAQTRKLKNSRLDELLDPIFISEDLGAEKPSPAFFEKVFAALPGIAPEEMLIVGDSLTSDILGGDLAGITTCWYNPAGRPRPEKPRIDYVIRAIPEVLEILDRPLPNSR